MSPDIADQQPEDLKEIRRDEIATLRLNNPQKGHPRARRDRGGVHATSHGLLSKHIEAALVRCGENPRSLRRYKKQFRAAFCPRGALGELFFDRWWSCYLRLILLARVEGMAILPDKSHFGSAVLPELREGDKPTLVTRGCDIDEFEITHRFNSDLPQDLFHKLALMARYDGHFAREANRIAGLLLLMRKGGKAALELLIKDGLDVTKLQKMQK